jgi:hypothetical protein
MDSTYPQVPTGDAVPSSVASATPGTVQEETALISSINAQQERARLHEELIRKPLFEDMQSSDESIAANAIERLVRSSVPNYQKMIFAMGGHSLVLLTMKKWPHSEAIQVWSCCLVTDLAYDGEIALALARIEVTGVITTAIKNFPSSSLVQLFAMTALHNFSFYTTRAHGNNDEIKSEARRFVHQLSGITLILAAMTRFPSNAMVQKHAIGAMSSLCADDTCKTMIRNSGAITAVAIAIDYHPKDEDIQSCGSLFMQVAL